MKFETTTHHHRCILTLLLALCAMQVFPNPATDMLERIDKGASKKITTQLVRNQQDFFELDQDGQHVVVRGNTYVNIATGINWYLKYYAGIHLSWNGMKAQLPRLLPPVKKPERHTTPLTLRYNFNYCTYSYSMAFWDWDRWQREIDWMALHGINMPLAAVGEECVWKNMLSTLGYQKADINRFIAGPAFLAWWAMNNLEGWGGPNPDSWYTQQEKLQKKILRRMREWGMKPVLPGFSGMMPHDANEKLGMNLADAGLWNGFTRPAFLQPSDKRFQEFAARYYQEQKRLFGIADYYSMDPFHESKDDSYVDYDASGKAILQAMKAVNPKAVWVLQGWTENPRPAMVDNMKNGDILILDLFSECRPMWGIPSIWKRNEGYKQHDWIFCLLENFGANVGLHGRMDQLIDHFYLTQNNPFAQHLKGIGLTMEGIENNPVMFELMSELPWRPERFSKENWIAGYVKARYGVDNPVILQAWQILAKSIYNCPADNNQQGTHESIFCGRPSQNNFQVSSWSKMKNYYDPEDTKEAARLMISVADAYRGNNNFEYDLVDIVRQAMADQGRIVYNHAIADFKSFNKQGFDRYSQRFLHMLLLQDELLATRTEFRLGRWTGMARRLGNTEEEKDLYEWNARVQITTWGNRTCADGGGLRDYAHKEWNGLLKDFYYKRWATYFKTLDNQLHGENEKTIDFYAMEEPWTTMHNRYSAQPEGNPVDIAKKVYHDGIEQ